MKKMTFDAIVVGARVAGSPTAMLLARRGHRVLLVDKATFPSDTMSTHNLTLAAMASLKRWGLYETIAATDCPPIDSVRFDHNGMVLEGWSGPLDGINVVYNMRRSVLDNILVEAAVEAGVEFQQGFSVKEIIIEDGHAVGIRGRTAQGESVEARATIVIGADGRHSRVAEAMGAEEYMATPAATMSYFSYWSGVPMNDRIEVILRGPQTIVAMPTNGNRTMIIVQLPVQMFHEFRKDIEGNFQKALSLVPELHARVEAGQRKEHFRGTVDVANIARVPYGPGFALVGDAGLHNDPALGQGITNAFRDAELLAPALARGLHGTQDMADALREYHQARDAAVLPMFQLISNMVSGGPPPAEVQAAFAALPGNQHQIDRFVGIVLGTVRVEDFYSPENLASIAAAAQERELVAA